MKRLFLLFFPALLCTAVFAHDFEVGGIYYNITSNSDLTVSVTYKGSNYHSAVYIGSVVIPTKVTYNNKEYSVTSIVDKAFYECSSLINVTIPNSVISIGESAFRFCSGLTSVTIPNSVTSIGSQVFCNCDEVASIKVESGNSKYDSRDNCNAIIETETNTLILGCKNTVIPNSVTSIGEMAFFGCSGLTGVTISNLVTSIGKRAFWGCSGLTNVTIPNSVISIGERAFRDCSGLTGVTIPNSVINIGERAFERCSALTSVTIPNSVNSIGLGTFTSCSALTSVTIPNSVTNIGDNAFRGCTSLTSITIPDSVTSIGNSVFYDTGWYNIQPDGILYLDNWLIGYKGEKLTGIIKIKEETKGIAGSAFRFSSGLTSVTIPNSVTSIGEFAFDGCSSLSPITSEIKEPFVINSNVFNGVNASLYVPAGTKDLYEATEGWNIFKEIIENAESLEPKNNENKDYGNGNDINEDTNLDGNVVDNIYYNITPEDGGYSATDGCIVLNTPVSDDKMNEMEGQDIFGEDFKEQYTGIVFKVNAGKGEINVTAESKGNMTLKIKVGDSDPMKITLAGKMTVSMPYTVNEATYVFIYGSNADNASAKGMNRTASTAESALKIYGISWTNADIPSALDNINVDIQDSDMKIYNVNGQSVINPTYGLYIINGKKVIK